MPGQIPQKVVLYHFTTLSNLAGIVQTGALLCKNLSPPQIDNASDPEIQKRRSKTEVPCAQGGTLHDYVPFYFAPRSPMLFKVTRGGVPSFKGNPEEFVYLLSSLGSVEVISLPFAFTDSHPLTLPYNFYDDLKHLGKVDWNVMKARQWSSEEDTGMMGRRQAEFLVYQRFPWDQVERAAAKTPVMARRVVELLGKYPSAKRVEVLVKKDWYY